ncbi:IS6 family transposase ISBmu21 [Paraburkholderia aspalathi]|nr:IS6 family transposase [Paraburkholderia aspalathi]CAE6873265.1 IS6 family transposase ISBmu21 [Paraburkholderia aspalathi]CAE6874034.1 IS6 family transposase ISBmu21 [Paraburkholderia aspalathi]
MNTYNKDKGWWKYRYRSANKAGNTIDLSFQAKRDKVAARRFFDKAIGQSGSPETVTIDKSGAKLAALNAERETPIKVFQSKYLNNIVGQHP